MARLRRFTIKYIDGTEEPVAVGLKSLVLNERKWPFGAPITEGYAFAAFTARGGKFEDEEGYEEFLGLVEDIEPVVSEEEAEPGPSEPVVGVD